MTTSQAVLSGASSLRRPPARGVVALIMLLGAGLLLARRADAVTTPFIWAEDGAVFLQQALTAGPDLLTAYNGQLWLLPRSLMAALTVTPLTVLPLLELLASLAITVLSLGVLLQRRLAPLFGGFGYQVLAFGLLLVLPGAWESLGTGLSLHWWLVFSAAAILIAPPARSRLGLVSELLWLAAVGLTGLVSWIVLPIAAGALIMRRDRATLLRIAVVALTSVIQFIVLVTSSREVSESASLVDMARIAALRIGGVALLGEQWLSDITNGSTGALILLAGGVFVLAVLVVAVVGRRWPSIALAIAGAVSATLGILGADEPLALLTLPQGGRYFVPALGFGVLILVLGLTGRRLWLRVLATICLVAMTFAIVMDFSIPNPAPVLDPAAWSDFAACVEADAPACEVAIAPEGWKVSVP